VDDLKRFSDDILSDWTGLPLPNKQLKTVKRAITFEGSTSPYVRMDPKGFKASLKDMKDKGSTVIDCQKIRVQFDFFLETPITMWLLSKRKFTRESLAYAISMQFRELFDNKKKHRIWCTKLAHIHLYAVYFDAAKNLYRLDIDLQN